MKTQEIKSVPQRHVAEQYLDKAKEAALAAESAISHLGWAHCLSDKSDEYNDLYDIVLRLKNKLAETRKTLLGDNE